MDITIISDTHGLHDQLNLASGDVLIHAGDITELGEEYEVFDFLWWFKKQPYRHKIFIAGNHDFFLEQVTERELDRLIPESVTYLQNSSIVINGYKIYGSPYTPYHMGMAFNKKANDILTCWNKIPIDTDILITHGPPKGILDREYGCPKLLARIYKTNPKLHCFGHIHEMSGILQIGHTQFVNASLVIDPNILEGKSYEIISKPINITL